ncbi:MAG: HAMP domain-containing sensor histidine kinase [Fimbriimonadaceae bacterium]
MPEKQSSDDLEQLAFAITALGLIVYGAGAWFLVGATLKPISRLVDRVNRARSDPSLAVTPPSTDREVVALVDTLNALTKEVRTESEERINSYATLSRELRTPIHSLLLKLDLALGSEQNRDELETTLVEVQKQVYRLKNLSEAVLTLQGLSQTSANVSREVVEVKAAIEEIAIDLQPLMELKTITLDVQMGEALDIWATREHLHLLMRNVLENAVKHSPHGSLVTVTKDQGEAGLELRFQNPSSEYTQYAGNGLGLRICREIARVNGWQFEASEDSGMFRACVRLKAAWITNSRARL